MKEVIVVVALAGAACAPAVPRIEGAPGAPSSRATPWPAPASVRTPPPDPTPPSSPAATAALQLDSAATASGRPLQFSLAEIIDLALNANPATRASWAGALAAAEAYGVSRGALYPTINGQVQFARTQGSGGTFGGTGFPQTGVSVDTGRTQNGTSAGTFGGAAQTRLIPSATLSYLLLDFGGRRGTIDAAKQRAIGADFAHNSTIQDVILQVESTLFSFLATRALRDAQVESVQESTADLTAAEERFRHGVASKQDVLQARTTLEQARLQLEVYEGSLITAHGTLADALGLPANARFDVPAVSNADTVPDLTESVDTLVNRAITNRADLAQARVEAAALAAEVRVARAAGYPALTLSSTANYVHSNLSTATGRASSLVLGLQIPVFNGFARQYDVRSAQATYDAGLARVTSTERAVALSVWTAYYALQTATKRVRTAAMLLAAAQESADVAEGRYREGVGTIIDVLLGRRDLTAARAESIQSRWEWRTALVQLGHDLGTLDHRGRPNLPPGME